MISLWAEIGYLCKLLLVMIIFDEVKDALLILDEAGHLLFRKQSWDAPACHTKANILFDKAEFLLRNIKDEYF